jgi:hypothetical protein
VVKNTKGRNLNPHSCLSLEEVAGAEDLSAFAFQAKKKRGRILVNPKA